MRGATLYLIMEPDHKPTRLPSCLAPGPCQHQDAREIVPRQYQSALRIPEPGPLSSIRFLPRTCCRLRSRCTICRGGGGGGGGGAGALALGDDLAVQSAGLAIVTQDSAIAVTNALL